MTEKQLEKIREKNESRISKLAQKNGITPEEARYSLLEKARQHRVYDVITKKNWKKELRILAALYFVAAVAAFVLNGGIVLTLGLFVAALITIALGI